MGEGIFVRFARFQNGRGEGETGCAALRPERGTTVSPGVPMNRIEERSRAAVKVQAAFRAYATLKRNAARARAAVVIQRSFRRRREYGAASRALENARRQRRIRRHELEVRYLKNLPSDLFENYKSVKRDHAATVIQRAWRRRSPRGEVGASGRLGREEAHGVPGSSSEGESAWEDAYADPRSAQGQTNCTQYWSLLPQSRRRELLEEIRSEADRASVYDRVRDKDHEAKSKRLLQECHNSLGRFAALQRAKSRLSKKTALLSSQLSQTRAASRTLEDVATSAQIDYASLPPVPTGRRLEAATAEHETCLDQARQVERSRTRALHAHRGRALGENGDYPGFQGGSDAPVVDEDVDSALERRSQAMRDREAQVAQDWAAVENLVELARSYAK